MTRAVSAPDGVPYLATDNENFVRVAFGHWARRIGFDCSCEKAHSVYFLHREPTATRNAKFDFQNAPGRDLRLGTPEL